MKATITGPVTLYHGTAIPEDDIRTNGLAPVDAAGLIAVLAETHAMTVNELTALIRTDPVIARRIEDPVVYLSVTTRRAKNYAVGRGEFERQILELIYTERFGEDTDWLLSGPEQTWVATQMSHRVPVMVTVDIPSDVILAVDGVEDRHIERVPPEWIAAVVPVTLCTCDHVDNMRVVCWPFCPRCARGHCPAEQAVEAGRSIDYDEDEEPI